jgi:DNA polymerase I-like protein with 3'-5' exonuclease and polymerase domains
MQVHDELVGVVEEDRFEDTMARMRSAMHDNDIARSVTVPITSNGYVGRNWAQIEDTK